MPEPIILATWSFGKIATAAGWSYLGGPNGSSLDAVEQACRAVESDLEVTSVGRGGLPDRCGEVSLDASIMQSPARCGSVCCVRRFEHPVTIARMVMERLHVVLLAGDGADRFALRQGLAPVDLLTDNAKAKWQRWAAEHPDLQCRDDSPYVPPSNHEECSGEDCPDFRASKNGTVPFTAPFTADDETLPHNRHHDTVGVLAIDSSGTLSGACSTSGLPFKPPGRVGDSPIIGHGLYVDPRRGAAVATGNGELIMGVCGSFLAVELMGRGASPADAAREVIQRIADSYELVAEDQAAIIAVHPSGQWSAAALRPGYRTSVRTSTRDEMAEPDCTLLP
jgi:isoaspartyl peptidase/L-asparaginase-like protein (Ntn-hydrolase superfamily)